MCNLFINLKKKYIDILKTTLSHSSLAMECIMKSKDGQNEITQSQYVQEENLTVNLSGTVNLLERIHDGNSHCPVCDLKMDVNDKRRTYNSIKDNFIEILKSNYCSKNSECPYCHTSAGICHGYGLSPESNKLTQMIQISHALGILETLSWVRIQRVNSNGHEILRVSSFESSILDPGCDEIRKKYGYLKSKFIDELINEENSLRTRQKTKKFVIFIVKNVILPVLEKCEKLGAFFQMLKIIEFQPFFETFVNRDLNIITQELDKYRNNYIKSFDVPKKGNVPQHYDYVALFSDIIFREKLTIPSIVELLETIIKTNPRNTKNYDIYFLVIHILKNIQVDFDFSGVIASSIKMLQDIYIKDVKKMEKMEKIYALIGQKMRQVQIAFNIFFKKD